ncbi:MULTISPECIES: cell division protein FtsX [Fusobacterium]|jgi:cell division protein ftsX|uniref:FtsX extracellular domain-containing protein n=2 Tax=Fusobacterium TaxID=848 RepID=K1GGT5_9FUSO|nr:MULTISPECIES: ABC transporter permease [Fusobacterium]ATV35129.1 ABC transporter permease [Fusobacterium pseudoperiodonticum]ATV61976.1 ABC transporter permease [Fusobacterium pseudoperiodonticum]EKA93264.1 hypothetical protein FPOG_01473 [Fusobacterium periodonticum D10]
MYKLFGYGLKDIPYINRLKNRVFYIIVITIVSLNIFISFSLNLKKVSKETLINSFIIVDLQNNLDEEKRNDIEKYILTIDGVRSVRFMDKSESFKNLQNELNISIPEASNPLTDSLIVSVKSAELMNGVQELIEAREEVKEVYKDEPYLKQSQEQSDIIHIAQIGSAVFSFLTALVTIVIFNLGVAIEFLNNANTGLDYAENIKESKFKNLIPFSMASVVATLIFFNIYVFFRKYVTNANFDSSLLSLREIFLWHIGAIAILNFLVWLIPANLGRIEYEEEKDDDLDYEFYEEEIEDKKDEFYDEFEDDDI